MRRQKREKKHSNEANLFAQMTDHFVLPADVIEQSVQLRVSGDREILIGNYKKLLQFTTEQIIVCGRHQKISITGRNLKIPVFAEDGLRITGRIESICFDALY